jgi:hypothetical protein
MVWEVGNEASGGAAPPGAKKIVPCAFVANDRLPVDPTDNGMAEA